MSYLKEFILPTLMVKHHIYGSLNCCILFLFSLSFVLLFVVDNNEVCTIFMKDHLHRTICRYGCHLSCNLNPSGVRWSAGQGIQFGDQEPTEDMRSGTGPQPNTIG